nr:hypothetical protein CFP56_38947 [Quercus suber]
MLTLPQRNWLFVRRLKKPDGVVSMMDVILADRGLTPSDLCSQHRNPQSSTRTAAYNAQQDLACSSNKKHYMILCRCHSPSHKTAGVRLFISHRLFDLNMDLALGRTGALGAYQSQESFSCTLAIRQILTAIVPRDNVSAVSWSSDRLSDTL